MKRNVRWLLKALSDRGYALIEAPVRNTGAFVFRTGVDVARRLKILPKPTAGSGILVVTLTGHFGDGVMLLPMLEAIHEANPGTPIDVACARGGETLFRAVPYLRTVYVAPIPSTPAILLKDVIARRLQIIRWYRDALTAVHPAVSIMPRWGDDLFGATSLAYLIGAPVRIAFASSVDAYQRRAPQRDRMATQLIEGGRGLHESERFLHVVRESRLVPSDFNFDTAATVRTLKTIAQDVPWQPLRDRLGLPDGIRFAVLAPGASHPRRVWPAHSWAELARHLIADGYMVLVLAGTSDMPLVEAIVTGVESDSIVAIAGRTSIPESVALLDRASLFIGADSGPGHAAGALGVPSVILYASHVNVYPDHPAAPARVRPLGPNVCVVHPAERLDRCDLACVADVAHCIATISVAAVLQAIEDVRGSQHDCTD